ncbi:D-alanyl-D-alanine carboxypeptidase/D-alanyl-D-alanine endopeptidase [Aeromicrobium sp.]|uniref:D-alanyl-D-alanine carboxypeptidase/D-alanyl-D-alanine endopeptidase n=1 Tax=Aeromicrobium sp. TaxID=1871063 RepID=UPI003D6A1880
MSVLTLAFLLVVMAGVAAGLGLLWSKGSLNELICDGACGPSAVATPDALAREGRPGSTATRAAATGRLDPDAIEEAVRDELGSGDLGSHVGFAAVDPADGTVVASEGEDVYVPASTTKLLTALAALDTMDTQQRFHTRVMRRDDRIVLVGGGDPQLVTSLPRKKEYAEQADLRTLARRTAESLRRVNTTSVRLDYDSSLFKGPSASPTWEKSYISEKIVTPVSALWVDGGTAGGVRVDDPPKAAADTFARLLERRGIEVTNSPIETRAPYASSSQPLATVRSATVAQIVEAMVAKSDNEAAEVLLRQAAVEAQNPASFEGGVATVEEVLERLDVDTTGLELFDGSGLSRSNRISPQTLAEVVVASMRSDHTKSLVSDLAVGGFTGTLARRFGKAEAGLGVARGKSGTLTGVHSLAGYVTDREGTPIAFAVMTDRTKSINPFVTEAALDRVVAALADCSCSSPVP